RFADEFVRHKILDIIGDLALVGRRIRGHVVAVKPGHAANAELARALAREQMRKSAMSGSRAIPMGDAGLDTGEVMKILPHRYPFLMVDRVIGFEGENKITAVKCITINEPFFQGHFPGHPVIPGVMQVETMAQVGGVLLMNTLERPQDAVVYFMSIDGVKFRRPVVPGDQIRFEVETVQIRGKTVKMKG